MFQFSEEVGAWRRASCPNKVTQLSLQKMHLQKVFSRKNYALKTRNCSGFYPDTKQSIKAFPLHSVKFYANFSVFVFNFHRKLKCVSLSYRFFLCRRRSPVALLRFSAVSGSGFDSCGRKRRLFGKWSRGSSLDNEKRFDFVLSQKSVPFASISGLDLQDRKSRATQIWKSWIQGAIRI